MILNKLPCRSEALLKTMQPLMRYLDDPDVTEVAINQPGELEVMTPDGWKRHVEPDLDAGLLRDLIAAMISYSGLCTTPIASVELPHGMRGQIAQPPAVTAGTIAINIRKHMPVVKTLEELDSEGVFVQIKDVSFNQPDRPDIDAYASRRDFTRLSNDEVNLLLLKSDHCWRELLTAAVRLRRNIVIAGSTGSGKTSLARSLIEKVSTTERLITIEDVHELHLPEHPNKVHLIYGKGVGRITVEECLETSLRQSPDRILLSEMRGAEAARYLESLNSGHPGSVTTVHANSAIQTFGRIAGLVKRAEEWRTIDMQTILQMLYETIDVVLYMKDRKVTEIFYDPIFARSKANG